MTWPTPIRVRKIPKPINVTESIRKVLSQPVINPFIYEFTSLPSTKCTEGIIIMVASAPQNFDYREAIRRTWARPPSDNDTTKSTTPLSAGTGRPAAKTEQTREDSLSKSLNERRYAVLFFLGAVAGDSEASTSLRENLLLESDRYGDLVISDFTDTYGNLSLKTMSMLRWADQFCPAKGLYLTKCDDDTYLNVPLLRESLQDLGVSGFHFVVGHLLKDHNANRHLESKYFMSRAEYRDIQYPVVVSGSAYAMKIETAKLLYKVSLRTKLFRLEDIYIIGFCAGKVGVDVVGDARFSLDLHLFGCDQAKYISGHEYSPAQMLQVYDYLQDPANGC
ncbi:beta-1,3-galactosyltransferase 1-like [Elysia marginata]|uniref:Hexosyltransferase n=1 Tax=Elysia marginata TaxID=1093978 RepID=A0AAV4K1I9_9GAST|nr:beta-1,3-galactosyltransferase 1-like [Elysia marginata]